ncbi:MAG: hypothetical protein COB65_10975 [Thalassobium sp.]|nr:MAG: hypothetical protein COB65_10975 [Thalassobium sp.]
MKNLLFLLTILATACSTSTSDEVAVLAPTTIQFSAELDSLPVGILIQHSKDTVYAELNLKDPEVRGIYKWGYATTVSAIDNEITITKFGGFDYHEGRWIESAGIYDRPFSTSEFEKWYSCPGGAMIPEASFTDSNNWTKGNKLNIDTRRALWYFIGVDETGKKWKGIKEIVYVGKMEE